jgi:hypothetical protein
MAWLSGYRYRQALYANTTTLATTESNFPVCLRPGDLTGLAQADMDDCVVAGADGTTIAPFYWENKTLAAATGHFLVATLTSGQAALLVGYFYYGCASATDQSNEAGVFAAFASRHSMADATDATAVDSTGAHNATSSGGTTSAAGKVGNGLVFDGVYSKLTTTGSDYIGASAATISAWIYMTGWGGSSLARIIDNTKLILLVRNNLGQAHLVMMRNTTEAISSTGSLGLSRWIHVCASTTAAGVANIYIDGGLNGAADQPAGTPVAGTAVIVGSRASDNARVFAGTLDDVRVALSVKSASWIKAEYMSGMGTLLSLGAQEDVYLRSSYRPTYRRIGSTGTTNL